MAWEPPTNKLEFADLGNALMTGAHARYYGQKADHEAAAEKGRIAAGPDLPAAAGGDPAAIGRVAQNAPDLIGKLAPLIGRMDAHKQAQLKQLADYTVNTATGILSAPAPDRPRLYEMARQQADQQGIPTTNWPAQYDEGWVRLQHGHGITAKAYFEHTTPKARATGGGSEFDAPSWGGKAPTLPGDQHSELGPALNGGFAPPDVQQATSVAAAPPVPPAAAPPVQQASAAPAGFQAMGHRTPDGQLVPAQINGQPVYRNPQTGEMTLGGDVQQASAPIYQGTGEPIQQGEGGPPGSPAGNGPPMQMAQAAPPATRAPAPSAPGAVVHEIPPGYEPLKQKGVPFVTKQGYIPLISQSGPALLLKPADTKPEKTQLVDVLGPDGKTLIGQRNPATNQYHPINQPAPSDTIDPTLRGEELLKSLDPTEAATVQAVVEGRAPLPTLSARMAPEAKRLRQLAFQLDPNFDATVYASRQKTQNDMADGKLAVQRTAADKLINHLGELHEVSAELNNSSTPLFNKVGNLISANRGDPRIAKFEATKHLVLEEADKFFSGTGGTTVSGMESMKKLINDAQSPQQLQKTMEQFTKLLNGQLDAMAEQYNRGMRYTGDKAVAPESLLSKRAQEAIAKIKANPIGGKSAGDAGNLKQLYGLE